MYSSLNHKRKMLAIAEFAFSFYEPGRQDRAWVWVWRHRVYPLYFIGYKTFLKYIKEYEREKLRNASNKNR